MCIVITAHNFAGCDLLLLANREEYFERPAEPLRAWYEERLYAGRDKLLGGTWLAVNFRGEYAAITNASPAVQGFDPGGKDTADMRSRGDVPLILTSSKGSLVQRMQSLDQDAFRPYFALTGTGRQSFYTCNVGAERTRTLDPVAPYILSNAPLGESERNQPAMALLQHLEPVAATMTSEELARTLDQHQPTERKVHLPARDGDLFGTRCSTAIRIIGDVCDICEISYSCGGEPAHTSLARFKLSAN